MPNTEELLASTVSAEASQPTVRIIDLTAIVKRRRWRQRAQRAWGLLAFWLVCYTGGFLYGMLRVSGGAYHRRFLVAEAMLTVGILLAAMSVWLCLRLGSAQRRSVWGVLAFWLVCYTGGFVYGMLRVSGGAYHRRFLVAEAMLTVGILLAAMSVWLCLRLGSAQRRSAWTGVLLSLVGIAVGVAFPLVRLRLSVGHNAPEASSYSAGYTIGTLPLCLLLLPASISLLRTVRLCDRAGPEQCSLLRLVFPWRSLRDYLIPEHAGVPWVALSLCVLSFCVQFVLGFFPPFFWLGVGLGIVLGIATCFAGRRYLKMRIRDLRAAISSDGRPPVLYLRSFADDRSIVWGFYSSSVIEQYSLRRPFTEFVCRILGSIGPVVAIAEPGRVQKTIGLAQQSFSDGEWQMRAVELMDRAAVIVLLAGRTSGLQWELEQLLKHHHLGKTIVLLPRGGREEALKSWWSLCDAFEETRQPTLPEELDLSTSVALLPSLDGRPVLFAVKRAKTLRRYEVAVRAALGLIAAGVVTTRPDTDGRRGLQPKPKFPLVG